MRYVTIIYVDYGVLSLRDHELLPGQGTYHKDSLGIKISENERESIEADVLAYGILLIQISTRCEIPVSNVSAH